MNYTAEQQRSDLDFLIGARYGKDVERARLVQIARDNGVSKDIIAKMEDNK